MAECWPSEQIPDEDTLFMRVHKNNLQGGPDLVPGAFVDIEGGMSTNWQKYCETPDEARRKARKPADNGVISLVVSKVRAIAPLTVEHTPNHELNDRSHTDVIGKKTSEVRLRLLEAAQWEIRV